MIVKTAIYGGVPTVNPINAEKSRKVTDEWKAAVADYMDRIAELGLAEWNQYQRREWVQNFTRYLDYKYARINLDKAKKMKTHKGRMKRLAEYIPRKVVKS